jgi:hypothetical protein
MVAKKTEQAIKVSATWTPDAQAASGMSAELFGVRSPLSIRGGRLTINAAIATDHADPVLAARVAGRIAELRKELEAIGTVHSFTTQAGAVLVGVAEHLPPIPADDGAAE